MVTIACALPRNPMVGNDIATSRPGHYNFSVMFLALFLLWRQGTLYAADGSVN